MYLAHKPRVVFVQWVPDTAKKIKLDVRQSDTVRDIKLLIQEKVSFFSVFRCLQRATCCVCVCVCVWVRCWGWHPNRETKTDDEIWRRVIRQSIDADDFREIDNIFVLYSGRIERRNDGHSCTHSDRHSCTHSDRKGHLIDSPPKRHDCRSKIFDARLCEFREKNMFIMFSLLRTFLLCGV